LEKVGEEGIVVGVDLNRFKKFHEENCYGIRGDFTTPEVQEKIMGYIGGKAKVVMSDASPSLCGIKNIDQLRSIDLVNVVIEIAENILEDKGNLVMKVFQGPEYKTMLDSLKGKFRHVRTTKPASSRKKSSEMYVVGLEYMPHKKNRKKRNKD
jgi:23S rRNA (uridine2552-2'-O)-methyltransferase